MSAVTTSGRSPARKPAPVLVPIDVNNARHHSLFQMQRILCGWKHQPEMVQNMFDEMRGGLRCLLWVCVDVDDLVASFPSLAESMRNVEGLELAARRSRAIELVLSKDGNTIRDVRRASSHSGWESKQDENERDLDELALPFLQVPDVPQMNGSASGSVPSKGPGMCVPVGHLSLDYSDLDGPPTLLLGSGDGRITALSTLFILRAFRNFGLATTSMRQAENILRADALPKIISSTLGVAEVYTSDGNKMEKKENRNKVEDVFATKLKCEILSLSMLSERHYLLDGPDGKGMWKRTRCPDFAVGKDGVKRKYLGPWYASMGFAKAEEMQKFKDVATDENGQEEQVYWWGEIWTKNLV